MLRNDGHFRLRIPDAEKVFIRQAAARNLRSITSEIIATIRDRMEREAAAKASAQP